MVLLLLWPCQLLHVTRIKKRVIDLDGLTDGENRIETGWIGEPFCISLRAMMAPGLLFLRLWRSLLLIEEREDTILRVHLFGT